MTTTPDPRLAEQIAYYAARAAEYDDWWYRRGRYDRGAAGNARWFAEVARLQAWVAELGALGSVLELAAGTGLWTRLLAPQATSLHAVDASPEVLALNRARVRWPAVTYEVADLFEWEPPDRYDTVFFSFWLSHVPPELFDAFWEKVGRALAPDGRAAFIDSRYSHASTAVDHQLRGADATSVTRRLNDGREFEIVKVFYEPGELAARLAALGWTALADATGEHLLRGVATRPA